MSNHNLSTKIEIEAHVRHTSAISSSTKRLLEQAEETGSIKDWCEAIKVSLQVQDMAGRELIRARLRGHLCEAASLLSGAYDGVEDLELGMWSDGASEEDLPERAARLLDLHKGMI